MLLHPTLVTRVFCTCHVLSWSAFAFAFWRPDSWLHIQLGYIIWLIAQIVLSAKAWQGSRNVLLALSSLDTMMASVAGGIIVYEFITSTEWELLWQLGHQARIIWISLLLVIGVALLRLRFIRLFHSSA